MRNTRMRHRAAITFWIIVLSAISASYLPLSLCGNALAAEPSVRVKRADLWTNLFAGKRTAFKSEIPSKHAGDATFSWSLVVARGVVARGEQQITLNVDRAVEVAWEMDLPEVKPGLIIPATLRLVVHAREGSPKFEPATEDFELSICSSDATALRDEWLKSLDIVLFDPAKHTAEVFKESDIPYQVAEDPQCADLTKGLIVYGERIEPDRLDTVWSAAKEAAAGGRRVLVLGSPGGTIPIGGLLDSSTDALFAVSFKRNEIIRELDKRLDAAAWPKPGRLVTTSLHWTVREDQPHIEFRDDVHGWPWLDVRHRNGGRLIWLGFGLAESWDATPTARYLTLKVFEELMTDKPPLEGKPNAN